MSQIGGLDSSYDRPTLATARAAYAAGLRVWGGYFGSRGGLGLATLWSREDFANVQNAGLTAMGFCSGWDNPDWIRTTGAAWGILPCVDVERGIRDDGPWVMSWVQRAQCGLYGAMAVHYEAGEPPGRGANFNILAWYPGFDPGATWFDAITARPPGPCGWQWQGSHQEFGLSVDRTRFDDIILPTGPGRGGTPGGFPMALTDQEQADLYYKVNNLYVELGVGQAGVTPGGVAATIFDRQEKILAALQTIAAPVVDVEAFAIALAPHLKDVVDEDKIAADLAPHLGDDVAAALAKRLAGGSAAT